MNLDLKNMTLIELVDARLEYPADKHPNESLLIEAEIAPRQNELDTDQSNDDSLSTGEQFLNSWRSRRIKALAISSVVSLFIIIQLSAGRSAAQIIGLLIPIWLFYFYDIERPNQRLRNDEVREKVRKASSQSEIKKALRSQTSTKFVYLSVFILGMALYVYF